LVVIGVVLIAEGLGHHIPKGYIYSAMTFSVIVEMLNLRMRKRSTRPVDLIVSIALPNKEENKEENK
jgi:predicted tellurium resistance membrane protein TerC